MDKRLVSLLLIIAAALWIWCNQMLHARRPLHRSVQQPGEVIDLRSVTGGGKTTVVHYYADWCGPCRNWSPTLQAMERRFADVRVVYVNIDSFDSPVAVAHDIRFVPNFKVFDPRGRLVAQDKAADRWVRDEIARRVPAAAAAAAAAGRAG